MLCVPMCLVSFIRHNAFRSEDTEPALSFVCVVDCSHKNIPLCAGEVTFLSFSGDLDTFFF